MFYSLNISLKLTNRLLKKSLQNTKIGIDKYMYFVYFCIVQNNLNKTKMKNLINAIDGLTIHETVRFIATLDANEKQEMASIMEDRYADVGINESRIIMNEDYVEGYAGNGFCTVDEDDYDDRFLKIYHKQN